MINALRDAIATLAAARHFEAASAATKPDAEAAEYESAYLYNLAKSPHLLERLADDLQGAT